MPADDLQASLERSVEYIRVPGAVMLIAGPDGSVWVGAAGFGRITEQIPAEVTGDLMSDTSGIPTLRGDPMPPDALFRAASIVKTMVAAVVMELVADGTLSLDDALGDLLPEVHAVWKPITVRQLLNHTSGIFNYTDHERFGPELLKNPKRKWQPQELIDYALEKPLYFPPGQGFAYSNTNYILLGMVLEKTTGDSPAELLKKRIFEPYGLKHTYFPTNPEMRAGRANGYRYDFEDPGRWNDVSTLVDPSWTWSAGSLVTNVYDLYKWLDILIGKKGEKPLYDFEMKSRGIGDGYGLGVGKYGGAVGHTGDHLFGYQSAMLRYKGYDFVIMTNGAPARLGQLDGPKIILDNAIKVIFKKIGGWKK